MGGQGGAYLAAKQWQVGLAYRSLATTVSLNVPLNVYRDFRPSLIDRKLGENGGGDLAKYLVFAGIDCRF